MWPENFIHSCAESEQDSWVVPFILGTGKGARLLCAIQILCAIQSGRSSDRLRSIADPVVDCELQIHGRAGREQRGHVARH